MKEEQKENLVMKLLQLICGLFGHKWVSNTKGQMCKRCGKKKNMDKWYYETKKWYYEVKEEKLHWYQSHNYYRCLGYYRFNT